MEPKLPADIKALDLKRPGFEDADKLARIKTGEESWQYELATFEMWYTEQMGWCIPTLLIAKASRASTTDRTYATTLDGKQVRIGKGPHVKRVVTVYVRESRLKELQHYLDLQRAGAEVSNQIRDRISSRRAQGQVERQKGKSSWRWDV
jgi:hypothetical protein